MNIIEDIVAQHTEDTGFLWDQRQRFLKTNILRHAERQRLDSRLEGHLDGLLIAKEAGWQTAVSQAESACSPSDLFALAALALFDPTGQRLESTLEYATQVAGGMRAVVSAVGWHSAERVLPALSRWLRSEEPMCRYLAVAGHAIHRRNPGVLAKTLRDEDPLVRARSAKMVSELGAASHTDAVHALLDDPEPRPRFEAAMALARFGDCGSRIIEQLITAAEEGGWRGRRAAQALALVDPAATSKQVRQWGAQPSTRRLAAIATAATGDPALVPSLIAWMDDDTLARVSGEAFRTLTGADIAYLDLERPEPPSADEALTDDPNDARVELEEDDGLAWPSATSVERWWHAHQARFPAGFRYLDGRAVAPLQGGLESRHAEELRSLIRTGRAGHAAMAAALLAQGAPRRPLIETRAPATRGHVLPGWEA